MEKWSPDVVVGFAKKHKLFNPDIVPCTTTLYQWIDRGSCELRKIKSSRTDFRSNKRFLGKSIEDRPEEIEERNTFGNWGIDTVVGNKTKSDAVLLALSERQTRFEVILKLAGKDAKPVDQVVWELRERAGAEFGQLFKTVTSYIGSEFSELQETLQDVADVYFSHLYASWERGTSENQHKLIRRFILKGNPINGVSKEKILRIQRWMSDYPRKILNYETPHDCFVNAFKLEQMAA